MPSHRDEAERELLASESERVRLLRRRREQALEAAVAGQLRYDAATSALREELTAAQNQLSDAQIQRAQLAARVEALETSPIVGRAIRFEQRLASAAPEGTLSRSMLRRALGLRAGSSSPQIAGRTASSAPDSIYVATSDEPLVSIVLTVRDHIEETWHCLSTLAAGPVTVPYEVIVVDDASQDVTPRWLERVQGVHVIRSARVLGHVGAANLGIHAARGEYIVLLHNDTGPVPGWLDALVTLADGDPRIGVVGARIVSPAGVVLEAGGVVARDGSTLRYGEGEPESSSRVGHVRDVDYCSDVALLVRRELLARLGGGLDEAFAPAHYQDVDLAFAARQLGYRTVYQPLARVVHLDGATYGPFEGRASMRAMNRSRFVQKWSEALASQLTADELAANLERARDHGRPRRALVLDMWVPDATRDSGSVRSLALIDGLIAAGYTVTLAALDQGQPDPQATILRQRGVEVVAHDVDVLEHISAIADDLALCVMSRPVVALRFIEEMLKLAPHAALIYDAVDLAFVRQQREADLFGVPEVKQASELTRELELAVINACHLTLAVSEDEASIIGEVAPGARVALFTNVHEVVPAASLDGRRDLVFVGGYDHAPNVDAARVLVDELMPRLRPRLPGVRLRLVGSRPTEEVRALATADVDVVGWVPDVTEPLASHRVFVAPLRWGAGAKGKVGQSLAHGLPVVTTAIGAEGMGLQDGVHVVIRDDLDEMAEAIVRLYEDDTTWRAMSTAGQQHVRNELSSVRAAERIHEALSMLGLPVARH